MGLGNGGAGGEVSLITASSNNAFSKFGGNIAVFGAINTTGGKAKYTTGGGSGGVGGAVTLRAGSMQITGQTFANDKLGTIITSGGTGFLSTGSNGLVTLQTYAVQLVPSNFNLTSSAASEFALPGGLFSIGFFPVINGTAGSVVSGNTVISSTNIPVGAPLVGPVTITATAGVSDLITIGGVPSNQITPGTTNANRNKVTPGIALALYQVSFGSTQTLNVNILGQVSGDTPSSVTVPQYDLPAAFSSFVLAAAQGPAQNVTLNISGANPVLNLSLAFTQNLRGTIDFSTVNTQAMVNAGGTLMTVNQNAAITSAGSLYLQTLGSPITNYGTISATGGSDLFLLNPMGAINFTNNGTLGGSDLGLTANNMPTVLRFANRSGSATLPIELQPVYLPTSFGKPALSLVPGSLSTVASTLILTAGGANGPVQLTGAGSTTLGVLTVLGQTDGQTQQKTNISVNGSLQVAQVLFMNTSGTVTVQSGSTVSSNGVLLITSSGFISTGSSMSGKNGIFLTATNGNITSGTTSYTSSSGSLILQASGTATGAIQLNAGNTLNGKFIVLASGRTLIDAGGNDINVAQGPALLIGTAGLTLGAGTTIDSPSWITLSASTGLMNLGGAAGTQLAVQSGGAMTVIASGGLNANNAKLSGGLLLNVIGGAANIADIGNSDFLSSGGITMIGANVTLGSGTQVMSGINSGITINASSNLTLGGAGTSLTTNSASLFANATGTITVTNASLTTTSASLPLSLNSATGMFVDNGGSLYTSANAVNLAGKSLTFGVNIASAISAGKGITLNATSGTNTLSNGSSVTTLAGSLKVQAPGLVTVNANLTAGVLSIVPVARYFNASLTSAGSIAVSSTGVGGGGVSIGNGRSFTASGSTFSPGNVTITANSGNISLGDGNTLQANGGNLQLLTSGLIAATASTGNSFVAYGVAVSASNTAVQAGGSIEMSVGATGSQLVAVLTKSPGFAPTPTTLLGTNIVINNGTNSTGVVVRNLAPTGGSMNLSVANQANLNLNGGAIVFDLAKNQSIQLNGATFTVNAFKPIAYASPARSGAELMVNDANGEERLLANLLVPGIARAQALLVRNHSEDETSITLTSGQIFLNPVRAVTVVTPYGEVYVRTGALVSVAVEIDGVRIAACSGPGDVRVKAGGRNFQLAPGSEALIGERAPSHDRIHRSDGVGRRASNTITLGDGLYLTVSEFSIITMMGNLPHLQVLVHPATQIEKRMSERLLKTAAALHHLTQGNGAYTANFSRQHVTAPQETHDLPVKYTGN